MDGTKKKEVKISGVMTKIAAFIVDKRMLFFLIYIIACLFSLFSAKWVKVENDITTYLDDETETRRGIDLMKKEFVTYGSAEIMVANVSFDDALALRRKIKKMESVSDVEFTKRSEEQKDFEKHYNNGSALYSVTFEFDEDDERDLEALEHIKRALSDYDIYVSTEMGDQDAIVLDQEMKKITVLVAIVVVGVLLLACQSFGEVPVLVLTFVASMQLNGGTNFLFGTISFISDSVSSILQLALSVDYAVILCNHYKEERSSYDVRDSAVLALAKSIPEVCSSSLTTISGLFALVFMHFGIGKDMGTILIKAILLSLLSAFTLMPGLLVVFSGIMEKTEHKSFIPDINVVGEFAGKTYRIVPVIFFGLFLVAAVVSQRCPYVFGDTLIKTPILNEHQVAKKMIRENFEDDNVVAVLMPGHDYEKEAELIHFMEKSKEVSRCVSLSNTEVEDGYMLTDSLTPRQLSEIIDVDYEICELLYQAYAADQEEYGRVITGVRNYRIPLMDMLAFMAEKVREGYVELEDSTAQDLFKADDKIREARDQLEGQDYDRMLVYLNLPEESKKTYDFLDQMHKLGVRYYGKDQPILIVGNSTSDMELKSAFDVDNIIVSVVSILFVLVVLLFTFKSAGLPLLQILVIEGAIFINFTIPVLLNEPIYFMSYLIVSSIQMGANIDYAIVISNRYIEMREKNPPLKSIIDALDFAFPTIVTSGTMMTIAGFSIGRMTSDPAIMGIGLCLGRGTLISIALVLFVLPQILLLGDRIISATTFEMYRPIQMQKESGDFLVNGTIQGAIHGTIAARVSGIVRGDASVALLSGRMDHVSDELAKQIEQLFEKADQGEYKMDPEGELEEAGDEQRNNDRGGEDE